MGKRKRSTDTKPQLADLDIVRHDVAIAIGVCEGEGIGPDSTNIDRAIVELEGLRKIVVRLALSDPTTEDTFCALCTKEMASHKKNCPYKDACGYRFFGMLPE